MKPRRHYVRLNHIYWIEIGESGGSIADEFPNANMFQVEVIPYQFKEIT
jgi:hypothetical protein